MLKPMNKYDPEALRDHSFVHIPDYPLCMVATVLCMQDWKKRTVAEQMVPAEDEGQRCQRQ